MSRVDVGQSWMADNRRLNSEDPIVFKYSFRTTK